MMLKCGANYIINKSATLAPAKGDFTNLASGLKREMDFIARDEFKVEFAV